MVRVWRGGICEADDYYDYYDAYDERGMLVWQDFPFACAFYAEEEPLRGEIEAEARENVTRLVAHPSLVLWNCNNENSRTHDPVRRRHVHSRQHGFNRPAAATVDQLNDPARGDTHNFVGVDVSETILLTIHPPLA